MALENIDTKQRASAINAPIPNNSRSTVVSTKLVKKAALALTVIGLWMSFLAVPSASASSDTYESDDVRCALETDPDVNFIMRREVSNTYGGCENFGKGDGSSGGGDQFESDGTCTSVGGPEYSFCLKYLSNGHEIIEMSDMEKATKNTGCVQLENWGNAPYGYDYIPNGRCLGSY